jgi:hypothetical protein
MGHGVGRRQACSRRLLAVLRLSHNWYLAGLAEADRGDEGQDVQARWAAGLALNVPSGVLRSNESLAFVLSAILRMKGA